MEVLGTLLDSQSSSKVSFQYRLQKAEACYWAQIKVFRGPGSMTAKLKAWNKGPAACARYGACSLHLSPGMLLEAKGWELKWLRRIFRLRRRFHEGQMEYNRCTARLIITLAKNNKIKLLHHSMLAAVFNNAWREEHIRDPSGR